MQKTVWDSNLVYFSRGPAAIILTPPFTRLLRHPIENYTEHHNFPKKKEIIFESLATGTPPNKVARLMRNSVLSKGIRY